MLEELSPDDELDEEADYNMIGDKDDEDDLIEKGDNAAAVQK